MLLGWLLLRERVKPGRVAISLLASGIFFLVTNFSVWLESGMSFQNSGPACWVTTRQGCHFWAILFWVTCAFRRSCLGCTSGRLNEL